MNGKQYRKNMIDRMVASAIRRFDENIEALSWNHATFCHQVYMKEIARIYGANYDHIVAKCELEATTI